MPDAKNFLEKVDALREVEAGALQSDVELAIRDEIPDLLNGLCSDFDGSLPYTLQRENLSKGVLRRLLFVNEGRATTIAGNYSEQSIDPKTAGFTITSGRGPIVIEVPSDLRVSDLLKSMGEADKSQILSLVGETEYLSNPKDVVKFLLLSKRLVHELIHTLQNFSEVDMSKPLMNDFVETAVRYYTVMTFRKNQTPCILDDFDERALRIIQVLISNFGEKTVKDILLGNIPRPTILGNMGGISAYSTKRTRLLEQFNNIKHSYTAPITSLN